MELKTIENDHINPYVKAGEDHVPCAGDVYAYKSPCCNGWDVIRLDRQNEHGSWECTDVFTGKPDRSRDSYTLKQYYRWIQNNFGDIGDIAKKIVEGRTDEVAGLLDDGTGAVSESVELVAMQSPKHIVALLDAAERLQNKAEEARLVAQCMVEKRKAELQDTIRTINDQVGKLRERVEDLMRVITVLNLYTGTTVDIHQIAEGDPAPAKEPLSLRQRILFMDEELCVHLEREADYKDVDLFFEWIKEPANRDIIAPEPRCVVCLKPKRFDRQYRSGDPLWDRMQNEWNHHTFVVIRNGDNLWWFESEDLEVYEWAFPHEDFEEKFLKELNDGHFRESKTKRHTDTKYRVIKYMMFLQGLIDQKQDLIGPTSTKTNLMKMQGVSLIRDDENTIGTGRKPWREFRKEKNALIRRGTRILYIAAPLYYDTWGKRMRPQSEGGRFIRFYTNDFSQPQYPDTGLYHADEVEVVSHYENGKPVMKKNEELVFRYLPGDTVFDRTEFDYRERKNRVSWQYSNDWVLNYDAVTVEELESYLWDRTLRTDFVTMIPVLMEMRRRKLKEAADEEAFKALLSEDIRKETGAAPSPASMDEAVSWWKSKVIYTRALRSDDRKAWSMIKSRLMKQP